MSFDETDLAGCWNCGGVTKPCQCDCTHDDVVENGICECGKEVDWVAKAFGGGE